MNNFIEDALLAKYLSGECSAVEVERVEAWIAADDDHRRQVEVFKTAWNVPEPEIDVSDTGRLWRELTHRAGNKQDAPASVVQFPQVADDDRKRWGWLSGIYRQPLWRYAAVLLMVLTVSLYFFSGDLSRLLGTGGENELLTVSPAFGQRESLTLNDGSRVFLDAGSQFRYPEHFNGDSREVYLSGEAYFEVAPDPDRPFRVMVDNSVIEVVGTRFNIRAWEIEQKITVTVSEGKILFHPKKEATENSILLHRGYACTLTASGLPTPPEPVDVGKSLSWIRNEIYFENTELRDILYQLQRWNNVKFQVDDSSILDDRLTIHLEDRPLADHLKLLGELVNGRFVRRGDVYHLNLQ